MLIMENSEEVLQMLERYSKLKPKDIPKELEDYLCHVARTGDTIYRWSNIKYLFREKLMQVIKHFHETTQSVDDLHQYPNVDPFNYETMKSGLLERLELFNAAPFTIQRLCELLTDPRKHYNRIDKYMRALEKNILVVSTIEPGRKQTDSENSDSLDSVVNGDLSLDVNVDIDMENDTIFTVDPSSTSSTLFKSEEKDETRVDNEDKSKVDMESDLSREISEVESSDDHQSKEPIQEDESIDLKTDVNEESHNKESDKVEHVEDELDVNLNEKNESSDNADEVENATTDAIITSKAEDTSSPEEACTIKNDIEENTNNLESNIESTTISQCNDSKNEKYLDNCNILQNKADKKTENMKLNEESNKENNETVDVEENSKAENVDISASTTTGLPEQVQMEQIIQKDENITLSESDESKLKTEIIEDVSKNVSTAENLNIHADSTLDISEEILIEKPIVDITEHMPSNISESEESVTEQLSTNIINQQTTDQPMEDNVEAIVSSSCADETFSEEVQPLETEMATDQEPINFVDEKTIPAGMDVDDTSQEAMDQ